MYLKVWQGFPYSINPFFLSLVWQLFREQIFHRKHLTCMLGKRCQQECFIKGRGRRKRPMPACDHQPVVDKRIRYCIGKSLCTRLPAYHRNERAEHLSFAVQRFYQIHDQRCSNRKRWVSMHNCPVRGFLVDCLMHAVLAGRVRGNLPVKGNKNRVTRCIKICTGTLD